MAYARDSGLIFQICEKKKRKTQHLFTHLTTHTPMAIGSTEPAYVSPCWCPPMGAIRHTIHLYHGELLERCLTISCQVFSDCGSGSLGGFQRLLPETTKPNNGWHLERILLICKTLIGRGEGKIPPHVFANKLIFSKEFNNIPCILNHILWN